MCLFYGTNIKIRATIAPRMLNIKTFFDHHAPLWDSFQTPETHAAIVRILAKAAIRPRALILYRLRLCLHRPYARLGPCGRFLHPWGGPYLSRKFGRRLSGDSDRERLGVFARRRAPHTPGRRPSNIRGISGTRPLRRLYPPFLRESGRAGNDKGGG